jgi:hypothetical protein
MAAVGSNARCGSDVLISNERSTTSVSVCASADQAEALKRAVAAATSVMPNARLAL